MDGADLGVRKVSKLAGIWMLDVCSQGTPGADVDQMLAIWVGLERPAYMEKKKRGVVWCSFFFFPPDLTPPSQHLGAHLAFLAWGSGGAGSWCWVVLDVPTISSWDPGAPALLSPKKERDLHLSVPHLPLEEEHSGQVCGLVQIKNQCLVYVFLCTILYRCQRPRMLRWPRVFQKWDYTVISD